MIMHSQADIRGVLGLVVFTITSPLLDAGYSPPGNAAAEVDAAKAFYTQHVFPKLANHQQALLVPGTFACSNLTYFPLAEQDEMVAKKLNLCVCVP